MTPDEWVRVKALFDTAVDLPADEQAGFVATASAGDSAVQAEVERLLAAERARAIGFLDPRTSTPGSARLEPHPSTALQPGEVFAGRYEIQHELGRGGFGVVYAAFDRSRLQRSVALKVIRLASNEPSEATELARLRFFEEVRIAANLSHNNIAGVHEAGESGEWVYMTQELAPGRDLRRILEEEGALPPHRAIAIARQLCTGLAHAHARGVVHRDIKPRNIIVGSDDHVKVTDFGIAQPPQEDSPLSGAVGGTPGYMAPEQLRAGRVDGRADIFAVGCVLYEMLAGCRPFEGATTEVILDGLHSEPSRVRGGLPRALDRIVSRAMRKNPDERYGDIAQLQNELADHKESRRLWPAAIAAAALVVAIGSAFYHRTRSESLTLAVPSKAGPVKENPKDGQPYLWIPPGTFQMGCSPADTECYDDEKPSHQVTISKGFWFGQTPVTVGAYKRFAETGTGMPPPPGDLNSGWGNDQMPVVNVTWDEAQTYCTWAGGRLPTEAEWEYAARGGSPEIRYGALQEVAWYSDDSGREHLDGTRLRRELQYADYLHRLSENANRMHLVGQKRPNDFGLYDMLGNAWEWVNDWYDAKYYQNGTAIDPQGPSSGDYRILRGGAWDCEPRAVRVSFRHWEDAGERYAGVGFRCVAELGKR